jgi:hypothetical protein
MGGHGGETSGLVRMPRRPECLYTLILEGLLCMSRATTARARTSQPRRAYLVYGRR